MHAAIPTVMEFEKPCKEHRRDEVKEGELPTRGTIRWNCIDTSISLAVQRLCIDHSAPGKRVPLTFGRFGGQ